jgi:hypothetical protein
VWQIHALLCTTLATTGVLVFVADASCDESAAEVLSPVELPVILPVGESETKSIVSRENKSSSAKLAFFTECVKGWIHSCPWAFLLSGGGFLIRIN